MNKEILTLESALDLLHEHMQNKNLRKHCYAVGKVLSAFYDYYKEKGINIGNLSKEQWEITGILHDADWELTNQDPSKHTLETLKWLKEYEVPEEIINTIKSHNNKLTNLKSPESILEWTLECCDELTGFIVAIALVMPNKKLSDVTLESILKKFKQKEFAKAVDRNQITQCEEKLGIKPEEFIRVSLLAMQNASDLLGL
ncbi:HDIG domain-containing protein [candidate division WWE3 bacterium]|uniref:HDIG domain-containing protein n=1 Tax=candidate division WWE3 bacterium TaxID=2053526 RepID=A0A7X9HTF7_UNCKA|nr:HDIG domain-containing protein [candidate division WWE3 bacterium]